MTGCVLACRLDNIGDVVLTGPAIRALAERRRVIMLTSASGAHAARLLPGVEEVIEFAAPWVGYEPSPVDDAQVHGLLATLRHRAIDEAVIFTSFHQSSLPLALLLRLAGIGRIAAISEDYPGSLLDVRCAYRAQLHEVEQNLEVAAAAGFSPSPGDDLRLRLRLPDSASALDEFPRSYVVVHPGASVAARALPVELARAVCGSFADEGRDVVVTGDRREAPQVAAIIDGLGPRVRSAAGSLSLADLCHVVARADVLVSGNTGPAHLAAAVGTPVVEAFAPVVDPDRWRPWGVAHRLLGDLAVPCAGCRARTCPRPEQVCVTGVHAGDVLDAAHQVIEQPDGVPA